MEKKSDDGSKIKRIKMLFFNLFLFIIFCFIFTHSLSWLFNGFNQYSMAVHNQTYASEINGYAGERKVIMAAQMPQSNFFGNVGVRFVVNLFLIAILTKIANNIVDYSWSYIKIFIKKLCRCIKRKH